MPESLFEMVDFAPPKPAHADGCFYCRANDDGVYPELAFHERNHLPMTCPICQETEANRLLFEMNHFRHRGTHHPVQCTSLYLRLNHLTYALLHRQTPSDHDLRVLELGWRLAPNGEQLPPPGWDQAHTGVTV